MSTKLHSTYLGPWLGILLLGTLIFANGCGSTTFHPPVLHVYVTHGNNVSVFAVPSSSSGSRKCVKNSMRILLSWMVVLTEK